MPARILPPAVLERRSDERQVFALLNALRTAYLAITGGGDAGLALFSTAIGRGDSTNTTSGHEDQMILQWQLPRAFPVFTFSMAGMLLSAAGSATVRARLGGAWNAFDGTVIATMNGASPTLARASGSGAVGPSNTETLLKLTLQSSAPTVKATFVGGFVIGN